MQAARLRSIAVWFAVIYLAALGFVASVGRGIGTIDSVWLTDGPTPEMTRLDRAGTLLLARLLRVAESSAKFRELDEQHHRFLGRFNARPAATLLHVIPAAIFIVLMPLQFSRRIRSRHLRWHRWSGRFILLLGIPIGLSALHFGIVTPFAGPVETSAIAFFGALFLLSLVRGFVAIRRHQIALHREWMIRMSAVAFGVSAVRIAGSVIAAVTLEGPDVWFAPSLWIGFSFTSAFAELWIRRTRTLRDDARDRPRTVALGTS